MKIKVNVSMDSIGQVIDDLFYLNSLQDAGEKPEPVGPFTVGLLQEIVEAAQKKAVSMASEGTAFGEVFSGGYDGISRAEKAGPEINGEGGNNDGNGK
jgi:hypothetical protein